MERKNFKVFEANLLFFLLAIVFITFGATVQQWDVKKGLLITEYGIILLPVILAGKLLGVDLKHVLCLNPIKPRTVVRIMLISFLILPTVLVVNLIPITILSAFDKIVLPTIPTPETPTALLGSFFIVAISPGICEEVLFRGLILNAYEHAYNKKIGAIVAAVLFGLFHFNIQNLFGPIIIGLTAAYLMQVTKSIYAAIVLHLTNNGIAVLSDYLAQADAPKNVDAATAAAELNNGTGDLVMTIIMMSVIAMIGILISRRLIKGLKRDTFYYALGEPFEAQGKTYYLVGKEGQHGRIISQDVAFHRGVYNLDAEKNISWKVLNHMYPERVHEIWSNKEIAEEQDPKVFAPLVGALGLYIYILFLFLTY